MQRPLRKHGVEGRARQSQRADLLFIAEEAVSATATTSQSVRRPDAVCPDELRPDAVRWSMWSANGATKERPVRGERLVRTEQKVIVRIIVQNIVWIGIVPGFLRSLLGLLRVILQNVVWIGIVRTAEQETFGRVRARPRAPPIGEEAATFGRQSV